ncbi:MAG: hypothetical protein Q8936_14130 [Bacillota bacterium]|nr:hypothetical protein [Bacillota bacterium]
MSYWGRYGHLSSVDAARESLLDIAEHVKPEELRDEFNQDLTITQRYDAMRLKRTIYGLQRVIWMNGGMEPITWLPKLFDHVEEQRLKQLTYNTKDGANVETKQAVLS